MSVAGQLLASSKYCRPYRRSISSRTAGFAYGMLLSWFVHLSMGGHVSDLDSLPFSFTQSFPVAHFSTRPPYFVFQYQIVGRQLT